MGVAIPKSILTALGMSALSLFWGAGAVLIVVKMLSVGYGDIIAGPIWRRGFHGGTWLLWYKEEIATWPQLLSSVMAGHVTVGILAQNGSFGGVWGGGGYLALAV
jgi:hypothetical protein